MTKTILTSTLLALLGGSAAADTEATYRLDLVLGSTGAKHTLYVTDHGCGELQLKSAQRNSFIKVCANTTDDKRVRLGIDRRLRDRIDEQSAQVTLVAAAGASFEVLDAKITVKAQ